MLYGYDRVHFGSHRLPAGQVRAEPGLRKALLIGIFLAIFNQAIGMNAISYYGPVMFSHMGFGGNTEFLASSLVGDIELVFTVVGMYLIDTAGRKKLMAVGSGLMVLFALGSSFSYANNYQLLMLIFVMCFTSCFTFSMGPIPWIMIPELFPTYLRGRATADLKQAESDIKAAEAELARARRAKERAIATRAAAEALVAAQKQH